MAVADRVRPVLETALSTSELVLEDVVVTPAGRRRVVRVLLDRTVPETGTMTEVVEPLSLDEVADVTRVLDEALEGSGSMGEQPYTLEVSSPGVGRPLTLPRHYRRNVGRLLTVSTPEGTETTGRLMSVGPDEVTLEVATTTGDPAHTVTLPLRGLERGVVQVEFARRDHTKES